MDLASAGVMLVPNTNYVLGGGKQGVLYLVNTNNMGEFNASNDNVRQEFQAIYGKGTSHIHGTASTSIAMRTARPPMSGAKTTYCALSL